MTAQTTQKGPRHNDESPIRENLSSGAQYNPGSDSGQAGNSTSSLSGVAECSSLPGASARKSTPDL